jgi:FtsP/CotA-like multicopper oxidase with cupredoxin domain
LVQDPREPKDLGDEVVLVLSDISLDDQGVVEPHDQGGDLATLFGREGTHMLVNGRIRPTLHARAGRRQRWRVLDAAKSRYFQVAIDGHDFLRIGGDGGLLEYPITEERFVITAAERADLLFVPHGAPGSTLTPRWVPYDRGFGSTEYRPEEPLFDIVLEPGPAAPTQALPGVERTIEPLSADGATPVALRLTQQAGGSMLVLGINDVPAWEAAPLPAHVGDTQLWTVENTLDWAHPFHLHGFFFQVLGQDGLPERPLAWRDTVNVGVRETVRILVRFDERPGMWMFHCHVLDHADAGMMGMVELVPRIATQP